MCENYKSYVQKPSWRSLRDQKYLLSGCLGLVESRNGESERLLRVKSGCSSHTAN